MKSRILTKFLCAGALSVFATSVSAASIISDGNVSLGVDTLGNLNISGGTADVAGETDVGARWIDSSGVQYESTSHGCACEGWGLAVDGATGFANNSTGTSGLTSVSFTSTATTATSVVQITGTDVFVTHSFALSSATNDLYEVSVSIENRGPINISSMEYRRNMDWDTSPTPFDEYVTIGGTSTTTLLQSSSADGFASSNPLSSYNNLTSCGDTVDFTACGADDHGALFDFNLGGLAAGETYDFKIFYGGAANKTAADAALGAVGAELYSYAWSGSDANQDGVSDTDGALTPTFIFAFAGVGGTVVVPPDVSPVPLPAGAWLLLGGLGALAGLRRRRKA